MESVGVVDDVDGGHGVVSGVDEADDLLHDGENHQQNKGAAQCQHYSVHPLRHSAIISMM